MHIGPCSRNMTQTALKIPNCKGRLEILYNQKLKAGTEVSMERFLKEAVYT
jgi:hypothetical protein